MTWQEHAEAGQPTGSITKEAHMSYTGREVAKVTGLVIGGAAIGAGAGLAAATVAATGLVSALPALIR